MAARHSERRAERGRTRFALLAPLGFAAFVVLALVAAWLIDSARHNNRVPRNVTVAGQPIGGLTRAEANKVVSELASEYPATQVNITSGDVTISTTAEALGATIDVDATTSSAMAARGGLPWTRFSHWLGSLRTARHIPLAVDVEAHRVLALVRTQPGAITAAPVEPTIRAGEGGFEVVDGKPGQGIDPHALAEALRTAAVVDSKVSVDVKQGPIPPLLTRETAESAARQADQLTNRPLPIKAGDTVAAIDEETLRSWIHPVPGPSNIDLGVNESLLDTIQETVENRLSKAGRAARDATVTATGGGFVVSESAGGTRCCTQNAARLVLDAFTYGDRSDPIELPLMATTPEHTTAEAVAIREPVATFTTQHAAGEPRVKNIHRIADLINGTVIWPGESLSVNDKIGRRTVENGFVVAPVIYKGKFEKDVGGGVSQFATTLFNAAFFAGLDFNEYQAHSIYITRYPYGREATLSFPAPDLDIHNTTPYAVYLQASYTETAITVTLWSTKYVDVVQSDQSTRKIGECTKVTTQRTRTYLDGRVKTDTVGALYQPKEEVLCN